MLLNGPTGRGIMYVNLKQEGDQLSGEGGQLKHPFDPPSTIRPVHEETTRSHYAGKLFKHTPKNHDMIMFERQNNTRTTWALAQPLEPPAGSKRTRLRGLRRSRPRSVRRRKSNPKNCKNIFIFNIL